MNADAFRQFYDYHFSQNRALWNDYILPLTQEQFTQPVNYSIGSIRNHVVHLMSVDDAWFSPLRGGEVPDSLDPADFEDRSKIRAHWDAVEQRIRDYLATLTDDMLLQKPIPEGEDKNLTLWQMLLHVGNHGTDHRAQMLRILHDLGLKTGPQDFIFYAYEQGG